MYYISKGTLKTANKQYTSINNDYEMTFNSDTMIEMCDEAVDLPTMTFDFVEINKLDGHQPGALVGENFLLFKISSNIIVSV